MQKPRGRYIKLNPVDYLLIALAILLAFTLLARGISFGQDQKDDRACRANVGFVIRAVDEARANALQTGEIPFRLPDGIALPATRIIKISQTEEYVPDGDGNMQPVASARSYDVHISFVAEGRRANDNTFLLNGIRRLSAGDNITLSRGGHSYVADFVTVQMF